MAAEQPDLVFTYTVGTAEGLDALLTEIRRHTTADIIVPSIQFKPPCQLTPHEIENSPGQQWGQIREICRKHGVEFVENRREMAEYLARNRLTPDDLLFDHVHQNLHGIMSRVGQRGASHRQAGPLQLRPRVARAADCRGPAGGDRHRAGQRFPAPGRRPAAPCEPARRAPG